MRRVLCVLVIAVVGAGSSSADAATSVSGATDASVPLIIDPATGPATTELDLPSRPQVVFLMPKVDRVLSAVTIGDFEQGSGCTTSPQVQLEATEHPRGDLHDDPGGSVTSRETLAIGATPAKLMFSFEPMRLKAGRGYSFKLTWADASTCRRVRQTTWEHNGPMVDSGPATCQAVNLYEPGFSGSYAPSGIWREYHRSGDNDRMGATCGNVPPAFNDLPGGMPTGWLLSSSQSGNDRRLTVVRRTPGTTGEFCNNGTIALGTLGIEEVFWYHDPARNENVYVCRFTQYAAPGDRVSDGWYYALPWRRAGDGPPRDGYLKVEYRLQDGAAPADFPAGPPPSALYGLGNPAAPNICVCSHADPVTSSTGNLSETYQDISVPGLSFGLDVTRSYNSQGAVQGAVGAMGRGWSASWTENLTTDAARNKVTITHANGSTVTFHRDSVAPGGYAPPPWVQAKLRYQSGVWYYTLSNGAEYWFSDAGKVQRVKDRNGQPTYVDYNPSGFLSEVTDAGGRSLRYETNADGTVKKITTPGGRSVNYSYTAGDLTGVDDLAGKHWAFRYDASHQLVEITDPRGNSTLNTYDNQNRVTDQVDREGNVWNWGYAGDVTTITDPEGSITEERFENNLLVRRTTAKGTTGETTETWAHDTQGNPVRHTDADAKDWLTTWTPTGDRATTTDPAGRVWRWTWNATHDMLSQTSPGGLRTDFSYDLARNLVSTSRLSSQSGTTQRTTFAYDASGLLTSQTDPLQHTTRFGYNADGDRISKTTPLGLVTTWAYDADGHPTSTISPRGNVTGAQPNDFKTTTEPDAMGRPLRIIDPLGRVTQFTYDANGNATKVTDPRLQETQTTFNKNDLPTEVQRPDLKIEKTSYDKMGQVKTQTDAKQAVTTYGYDAKHQLVTVEDPLQRTRSLTYTPRGELKTNQGADGKTATRSYDSAGRLTDIAYSSGTPATEQFTYDADGRITQTVDGTGTSTREYDSLGRMTSHTDASGRRVGYGYDLAGRVTSITYPGTGRTVTRAYDNDDRLTGLTDWSSRQYAFVYNPDGQLTKTTYPTASGLVDDRAVDRNGALTGISLKNNATEYAAFAYDRDELNRITGDRPSGLTGQSDSTLGYNSVGRLTARNTDAYTYDDAGNPTAFEGRTAATYDAGRQLQELTSGGQTTAFTYDSLGRRQTARQGASPATDYDFDQADRLSSVAPDGSTEPITYDHDAFGLRVKRTRSGTSANYSWDRLGANALLLEDGNQSFVYGPGGMPVAQIAADNSATLLHTDQLGSVRVLSDIAGATIGAASFTPYGRPEQQTGASSPLGYAGELTDPSTGLIYLRARDYDPATASFLTRDPIETQTRDPYGYAGTDPANRTDPSGLNWLDDASNAIAGWGDTYSGGATKGIRELAGLDDPDYCADAYTTGGFAGLIDPKIAAKGLALGLGKLLTRRAAKQGAGALERIEFGHGARHLAGTGLSSSTVEAAVEQQVRRSVQGGTARGSFWGRLTIDGKIIEYRGYGLDDGRINIGTYYVIP